MHGKTLITKVCERMIWCLHSY